MTTAIARLPPDLHLRILDRTREGAKPFDLGFELDVSPGTIEKLTAHLPRGTKRDLVVASVLARARAGEDVRTICSLENCSVFFVVHIIRAWARELDACARLSALKAPHRRGERRGR